MNRREFIKQSAVATVTGAFVSCSSVDGRELLRGIHGGDSIGAQYADTLIQFAAPYARVASVAYPGNTSIDVLEAMQRVFALGGHYDFVVVNACLNDFGRLGATPQRHWSLACELVSFISRCAAKWFWVSTTPVNVPVVAELIPFVNEAARGFCARLGGVYVPAGEFVVSLGPSAIAADAIHLTEEAARLLGEFVALEVGGYVRGDANGCRGDAGTPGALRALEGTY